MSTEKIEILWPRELSTASISDVQPVTEVPSYNPVEYVADNPVEASFIVIGAVGVGLALRWFNDRNALDTAELKAREESQRE